MGTVKTNSGEIKDSLAGFDGKTADVIGPIDIFRATGETVQFKDLWDQNEGMAVVALLRHFGCICSWELASKLKDSKTQLDSAGVKLIAVGVGTLTKPLPFPVDCLYADPNREAYNALDLHYGWGRTFFNSSFTKTFLRWGSLRKAANNYRISATPQDKSSVLQQGGMFVFKGKQLLYARKDKGTGDHASLEEILNICCRPSVA
ncbi:hypothetical protein AMTRI_Chr12g272510 [Amborella trichopoda]